MNFEKSLKQLEKIVEDLESGDMSLEESLKSFEKGIKLRFKRTAHFNKMNSIDAYITQLYQMEKL